MDDVKTEWIIGGFRCDGSREPYCAVIIPTRDEIIEKRLSTITREVEKRIVPYKLSQIEKNYETNLLNENVQISKRGNCLNIETLPRGVVNDSDVKAIEREICFRIYNQHARKWLLGTFKDERGEVVYVFVIPSKKYPSLSTAIYGEENILLLKEFPYLKNNNFRADDLLEIYNEKGMEKRKIITESNSNAVDYYVAKNLLVDKCKRRLFSSEDSIDKSRIRAVDNGYKDKNLANFDAARSYKLYIPSRVLCKLDREIIVLGDGGDCFDNEIVWTLDDSFYKENEIYFYTKDYAAISNLLRIPVSPENGKETCLDRFRTMNEVLKLNPARVEEKLLLCLGRIVDDLVGEIRPRSSLDG